MRALRWTGVFCATTPAAAAQTLPPDDPFAGIPTGSTRAAASSRRPWWRSLASDNFGFRKEVMSQASHGEERASRQALGFEVLKKFSTGTRTLDSQGRLVRRNGDNPVVDDGEGLYRAGWAFEYHNLYVDLYDVLHPLLSGDQQRALVSKVNFRAGRFYVPCGFELQTGTHGPVLQLSNDRSFGLERDWYSGFWGSLNRHLNYDLYWLAGSGYDLAFRGQQGLGAARVSLGNRFARYGLDAGVALLGGERPRWTRARALRGQGTPSPVRRPDAARLLQAPLPCRGRARIEGRPRCGFVPARRFGSGGTFRLSGSLARAYARTRSSSIPSCSAMGASRFTSEPNKPSRPTEADERNK